MEYPSIDCPYPGLRPFEVHEAHIFFGRELAISNLLNKLGSFRFVAVVGPSGCGKSSLIRAGLLPALTPRTAADKSTPQKLVLMRPGNSPIENLVAALHASASEDEYRSYPTDILLSLNRDPANFINTLAIDGERSCEYLFIVDQFEEIFRFLSTGDAEEAQSFVRLLLTAAESRDVQASVIVTMRADFVGDCTIFQGLPEAMNLGQFLVPRLTKDEIRDVLQRPAAIYGAALEDALINQVLSDLGTHPDQLPLMQHAMRRVWEKAVQTSPPARDSGIFLRLADYEAIGTIRSSLSIHAEEILHRFDMDSLRIAERMFRLMCEVGRYGDLVRRPVHIQEVAKVAQTSAEKVLEVAKAFSGLISPDSRIIQMLAHDAILDITHEALLRNWNRLRTWAEAERQSAEIYLRIEDAAQRYEKGKEALWRAPTLDVASQWWESEQPTAAWSSRYGSNFELSREFLSLSRVAQEEVRKDKKRRKTKVFISYRRKDNPDAVERIYERLVRHFGRDAVFYDVDTIPYGEDFKRFIDERVRECGVLLAIIGKDWLEIRHHDGPKEDTRRLDDPSDQVRIEIEMAFRAEVQVIPVLVGAMHSMPQEMELPSSIRQLAGLNAAEVFSGQDFHKRADKLIKQIEGIVGPVSKYRQWLNRLVGPD